MHRVERMTEVVAEQRPIFKLVVQFALCDQCIHAGCEVVDLEQLDELVELEEVGHVHHLVEVEALVGHVFGVVGGVVLCKVVLEVAHGLVGQDLFAIHVLERLLEKLEADGESVVVFLAPDFSHGAGTKETLWIDREFVQ